MKKHQLKFVIVLMEQHKPIDEQLCFCNKRFHSYSKKKTNDILPGHLIQHTFPQAIVHLAQGCLYLFPWQRPEGLFLHANGLTEHYRPRPKQKVAIDKT